MLHKPINMGKNNGREFTKVNTNTYSCKLHL